MLILLHLVPHLFLHCFLGLPQVTSTVMAGCPSLLLSAVTSSWCWWNFGSDQAGSPGWYNSAVH